MNRTINLRGKFLLAGILCVGLAVPVVAPCKNGLCRAIRVEWVAVGEAGELFVLGAGMLVFGLGRFAGGAP